ncbi:hypothetical protein [Euzebya tangerina]|uniref:hypothetical protein n=1 Tax=Euzebya tangerina TaxID=591198 RepID=UPI0013C2FCA1|nr:hypothetical protein [Euzebya tangerina]
MNSSWPRGLAPYFCLLLLFGGLVLDLNTQQELVVAIIYNIPIAVSGVLLSRQLTITTIILSLLANLAAGYDNAIAEGGLETVVILNRVLAAMSFLLVGTMTLLFETTSEEVEELAEVEQSSERERALRHFLIALSGPLEPDELMQGATEGLRGLLGADSVVISGLDDDRFSQPRWTCPAYTSLAKPGTLATWAVDALPVTATPVITVRSDEGIMSVGRWRCSAAENLVVLAARPTRHQASQLLGEALQSLEPLRERALVMHELRAGRPPEAIEDSAEADVAAG